MICRFFWILFPALLLPAVSFAQSLKGHVADGNGRGIAYATVYIRNTQQGISTNENGDFEIKMPAGTYSLVIQSMGYEALRREVTLPQTEGFLFILSEKTYQLPDVLIDIDPENLAATIIRHAIAMAPYYRNIVKEYTADVYLKTKIHIDQIKGLVGMMVKKDDRKKLTNATILQESINEIKFTMPDHYEQRVKSVINASSINLKDLAGMEFDEDDLNVGLTRFDVYSANPSLPLAPVAFSNYRFLYEGSMEVGDRMVNKIKVTPRRKSQELLSGYLYIVDKTWNIYSVDLLQSTTFGTVRIQQQYGEVDNDIFLPVSYIAEINLSVMGLKGSGNMTGSVKYQHVAPNEKIRREPAVTARADTLKPKANPKKEKLQAEVDELLSKENLKQRDMRKAARLQQQVAAIAEEEERTEKGEKKTLEIRDNYVFTVDSSARRTDSTFWNTVRPMPLVADELITYRKNDSIVAVATGKDTTKKKSRDLFSELAMGHTYRIDSSLFLTFNGLIGMSAVDYNTVDGYIYGLGGSLNKRFKNQQRIQAKVFGAWAFSREAFMWETSLRHLYAPKLRAYWGIEGGQRTKDFAGDAGVGMVNLYSSILFRVNYAAFYLDNFIRIIHRIDIANGLEFYTGLQWSDRRAMQNNSNHSFFYFNTREFRPNMPRHAAVESNPALTADNKAALAELSLRYTPQYYYHIRRGRKIMDYSDYPTFSLTWHKGIPDVFHSISDFDFLKFHITQTFRFGYFNRFTYAVETGKFFNTKSMSFADFKHFYANDAGFSMNHDISQGYQLLPGYTHSTNQWYVGAKAHYSAPYLLIKRLPFLESMLFGEDLYLSYLLEPQRRHYVEAGYGISLDELLGAGVFVGTHDRYNYVWGIRGSINLDVIRP
ncbi:MAG: DUF5686 and carboxypeptidase regulatory-like domain-containing protein [Prevotellaceae bacterium]|jgi:hypothetical protein|nr:DUF5686 and carboxypeptidase regulatory-like domain-containing protein [Prevotellaceae bacterium]